MSLVEINFDGIVGPTHNYAGLSFGNLASAANAGMASHPRAAALQGIEKMRAVLSLGLVQGILLPHSRPNEFWLQRLATSAARADSALLVNAMSASAMWTANAAVVSPQPDTNGVCHLTVANLGSSAHRSQEWRTTLAQLRLAFADVRHFRVHPPIPLPFGDEGAANHMRLAASHDAPGVEVFVYGLPGARFPARQHLEASQAVARRHKLDPERTLFACQSAQAIDAGAFHNDVVAVANESVLFTHELAFADKHRLYDSLDRLLPNSLQIIEVPSSRVSLEEAVRTYLFNAQLVTVAPGEMTLIVPREAQESSVVWTWLQAVVAGSGPIRHVKVVDVRESMANGGGPACLRLRVVGDPANVDPRFLVDDIKLDAIARIVRGHWPEKIETTDLACPDLWHAAENARARLFDLLGIPLF